MVIHPLAGKPATQEMLIDLVQLESDYYNSQPDFGNSNQHNQSQDYV